MTNDSCLRRSGSKTASTASVQDHLDRLVGDLASIEGRAKTAGLTVYLMEELGDARLRCEELVRYIAEATKLIEKSSHRDHFFEVAGHLIQGVPEALFKLQKALQAVSLAASRMDYEELKQELKPEKVDELEQVLKDIRIRHVQRRSDPIRPWEQNMIDDLWKSPEARSAKTEDKEASVPVDRLKGAVESIEKACKDIKHHLGKGEKAPMDDVLTLFNEIRGTSSVMVRRLDKNASEDKEAAELSMDVAGDFQAASLALKNAARGLNVKKNTSIAVHLIASAVGKLKETRSSEVLFRAYDIMRASGMWDLKEEALETHLASEDDKRSRFEEGKPADPTENMSPEDAKKWKEEHAKNKDNFKSARTTASSLAAKLEKLANDLYDLRAEVRWSANEVQELLSDAAGLILPGAYAHTNVKGVRDELREADNAMGAAARGSEYLVRVLKGQRTLEASKEACGPMACGEPRAQQQQMGCGEPTANEDIYGQIKPGCGVTIMTPHGQQVTGMAIARGPAGWILNVKGRPGIAHPENVLKVAGGDEKESRFEEGKPADPTENMSPEDAKKWKEEHAKNKDNFKSAARIVPLHEAQKGDMVEIEVGTPWPNSPKKEKVTGKVVRVLKDGRLTVDVEKTRANPGGHPNEDVSYVDVTAPKKAAAVDADKSAGAEPWKAAELKEMQDLLKKHGYDSKDAKKLQQDGMGPYELEHRIKTTQPGEMGSLEFTHGLKKKTAAESELIWKADAAQ